jgi:hypothetical protein
MPVRVELCCGEHETGVFRAEADAADPAVADRDDESTATRWFALEETRDREDILARASAVA